MIRSAMRWCLQQLRSRFTAGLVRQDDLDRLYNQVFGLMQIHAALAGGPVLKPAPGWALLPDAMAWILADLQERKAPTIVEFGCGQSTVVFAAWVKNHGTGRVISFEHDSRHAAATSRQLAACGLSAHVDIQVVPLCDHGAVGGLAPCRSYALPDLSDLRIDVALVDGPPYWAGDGARYHPLRWAMSRLAVDGSAYLDDTIRSGERSVLHELSVQMPGVVTDELRAQNGLVRCGLQH